MAPPLSNPYAPINLQAEREKREREAAELEKEAAKRRTFDTLMSAANRKNAPKPKSTKDPEQVRRGKLAAITRKTKQLETKKRYRREEDNADETVPGGRGAFQPTTMQMCVHLSKKLKESVGFKQDEGTYKPFGKWPNEFGNPTVDPSSDPYNFHLGILGELRALKREDFACRPIMFWGPENRWPHLYPDG